MFHVPVFDLIDLAEMERICISFVELINQMIIFWERDVMSPYFESEDSMPFMDRRQSERKTRKASL